MKTILIVIAAVMAHVAFVGVWYVILGASGA